MSEVLDNVVKDPMIGEIRKVDEEIGLTIDTGRDRGKKS
jgi:hypothetical protein